MTRTTLGIDLGGCMSGNSAFALIAWDEKETKVIELFKEPKHKEHHACTAFLKEVLTRYDFDAVGIDAPFSLPKPLMDPSFKPPSREGSGEIINPYLFRYSDYWLYKTYGLRPMPPAGDRIGRLTARMVELLHFFDYHEPFVKLPQGQRAIYEVYPKQIALALGYKNYKKEYTEILNKLGIADIQDDHLVDAVLAAFATKEILNGNTIEPVFEAEGEGWCYPLEFHIP